MKTNEEIKQVVKEKYGEIALQSKSENVSSCCGAGGCSTVDYSIFSEDYSKLEGYNPDADLALGCGIPTQFAGIKKGDTVVDLGSGAGNDCFVARAITGESGKIIGVDMTEAMINKARENAEKLNFNNVEFRFGDIEKMPITANVADVVISNCVLNLVPDKQKAFSEIFRVLKPGAHFCISDVVLNGQLHEKLKNAAEMYAGCVSGALQKQEYLNIINAVGFKNVEIKAEKQIFVPDDILANFLTATEIEEQKKSNLGIFSITVHAEKPDVCCSPGGNCC